jgi:hypothetical protein
VSFTHLFTLPISLTLFFGLCQKINNFYGGVRFYCAVFIYFMLFVVCTNYFNYIFVLPIVCGIYVRRLEILGAHF